MTEDTPSTPGLTKVELVQLSSIWPCRENDAIYGVPSIDDPDIIELIESIRANGLLDPIHVSTDNVVISGHRRRFCAYQAGLVVVPIIRSTISYRNDREAFLKLLVEANTQRKKTPAILVREAAMRIDPLEAHEALRREQQEKKDERLFGSIGERLMETSDIAGRKKISEGAMPFLQAALGVINANRDFWPLSVRQIHYRLLNNPPLKFTAQSKKAKENAEKRRYANDESSYESLLNLLARARIEGLCSWDTIDDETRTQELNFHYWNPGEFAEAQIKSFMSGYQRNRQQSQAAHIEIVAEKLTVRSILSEIAAEHSLPLTISRGHSGPTMKRKIAQRFRRSEKATLIVLVVSDLDPAGEAIVQNMHDDLIDDHGIRDDQLEVYRAGLTMERVDELDLTPSYDADEKDISTKQAYVDKYGTTDAYELEAMEPSDLQDALVKDINDVLDIEAYNAELDRETDDAVAIQAKRRAVIEFLKAA